MLEAIIIFIGFNILALPVYALWGLSVMQYFLTQDEKQKQAAHDTDHDSHRRKRDF